MSSCRAACLSRRPARAPWLAARCSSTGAYELRVCTGKTCKKQGSKQILQFAIDLALPEVEAVDCGCLGQCGSGPNAALLGRRPGGGEPARLSHLTTPARLGAALALACGVDIGEATLRATELRLAGNAAARGGDLQRAVDLYTQALELGVPSGRHLLLSNRSGTLLALGQAQRALADAEAAVAAAPPGFTTGAVRQADALCALGRHGDALRALHDAAARWPAFERSDDYRSLTRALERAASAGKRGKK